MVPIQHQFGSRIILQTLSIFSGLKTLQVMQKKNKSSPPLEVYTSSGNRKDPISIWVTAQPETRPKPGCHVTVGGFITKSDLIRIEASTQWGYEKNANLTQNEYEPWLIH